MKLLIILLASVFFVQDNVPVSAQTKPMQAAAVIPHPALGAIPAAAQFDAAGRLDPEKATQGYLNSLPLEQRQASDKYFEGG